MLIIIRRKILLFWRKKIQPRLFYKATAPILHDAAKRISSAGKKRFAYLTDDYAPVDYYTMNLF